MLRPFLFQWQAFLDTLGDRYWDENKNPAYKLFLG
jgi:threonine dehydratase